MKKLLLATTILAVTAVSVHAASTISVTSKAKEIVKQVDTSQTSGEIIEIKPNQVTKGDIKPVSAFQDNKVTVNGGTTAVKDKIFGADSVKNDVQNNTVILNKGNYLADVFGAQSYNKDAVFNTVEINGIASFGTVFGGISYHGDANNNTVKINGSTMTKRILGGHSNNKNAANNKVEITDTQVKEPMYGGFSYAGDALNNTLTIKNSMAGDKIYGGFSRDSNSKNNKLVIENSNIMNIVYGGASTAGTVSDNELTVISGSIMGDIYGGYSDFGNVSGNTLTIKAGSFNRNVYDGYSQNGKVENNRIIIEGGEFTRTGAIVANYITLSDKPTFNTNMVISGRCDDRNADADCLIKFSNFKGGAFKNITKAKKVEIDADSTVAFTDIGPVDIGGDLDIAGTFGFYHQDTTTKSTLVVNNLNADNATFVMTNNDAIKIKGSAKGTATIDIRFPNEAKLPKAFRLFDGDTALFDYTLKNEYILSRDGWHSIYVVKDAKQPNQVDVLSPKTLRADNTSLAIPIEAKQDTVDRVEIVNNGDINITNGTANLINARDMIVNNGTIFMDYNDYFKLGKLPTVTAGNLVINVGAAAKEGKYKLFVTPKGEAMKVNDFNVTFNEENSAYAYVFKDGILEIQKREE